MNIPGYSRYLLASLLHYRKKALALVLGSAVTATVITGALVLGDSVRCSLKTIALGKIGRIRWSLKAGDHLVGAALADRMERELEVAVVPGLLLTGTAASHGGARRANTVQVAGVDDRFFTLSPGEKSIVITPGSALINAKLARQLNVKINDEVTVSVRKPAALPTDSPFSAGNDYAGFRLKIQGIAGMESFGGFSLGISPGTRAGIFVSRDFLAAKLGVEDQANTLLVAGDDSLETDDIQRALSASWTLDDAGFTVKEIPGRDVFELRTRRVFLDRGSVERIRSSLPGAEYILSYFVNSIRCGRRSVPYSIVTSLPQKAGSPLPEDGIVINTWLAEDLEAGPGDRIELEYYVIDQKRKLQVQKSVFTVHSVIPLDASGAGRTLMPDFPGLSEAGTCSDWSPGIPIDLEKIRDRDEQYWDTYRGTPKAFIGLSRARELWGNQFGDTTGIRFKMAGKERIMVTLPRLLGPAASGLRFEDIRGQQVRSSEESVDFSQLFLALSFFIVLASLLLTGLFFGFYVESRAAEIGTLHALGYTRAMIYRRLLSEGALLAAAGSALGIAGGILYNHAFIHALSGVWYDAVRAETLILSLEPLTVCKGFALSIVFSAAAMYVSLRSLLKKSVHRIQRGLADESSGRKQAPPLKKALCAALPVGTVLLFAYASLWLGEYPPVLFFTAASLLLAEGILAASLLLDTISCGSAAAVPSAKSLALSSLSRRPGRSLAVTGLLSVGIFMIISVSSNRSSFVTDTSKRQSGTGGFSLFCRTTHPVTVDLNSVAGRNKVGLKEELYDGAAFTQLRLRDGDDASCLNPNRTFTPQILGVDPAPFARRGVFTFSGVLPEYKTGDGLDSATVWELLQSDIEAPAIPAIADQTVIQWGLGKSLGDSIVLSDETGQRLELKLIAGLANSILQGYVLISEKHFLKHFPSQSGFRVILADVPGTGRDAVSNDLSRMLLPQGIEVTGTAERLAEFNSVQDAYLSIFLVLGGFGMLLGTAGLGILIIRNVLERRGELALLQALGFSKKLIVKMFLYEYLFLLAPGIFIGAVSAALAVAPLLAAPGARVPWPAVLLEIFLIAAAGVVCIYTAGRYAVRGDLLPGLREE